MDRHLAAFLADESGQDLVEYALLAAFIAVVSVAALNTLGGSLRGLYERVNAVLN
jgi:pilus assembly protein Flp/PilA